MSDLASKCQAILDKATHADNGPAGICFGAVDRHGKVLVEIGSGKRSINDSSDTMTPDSVFSLWSTTKMIGTMAAMQLIEQGKLDPDEPVGKLLPELAKPMIVDEQGKLRPATKQITLRQLMTHTAGFAYPFFSKACLKDLEVNGGAGVTDGQIDGVKKPLVHEPGEHWEYGINIDWVGEAVARASGMRLGDYIKQNIFEPLGVKDTAFEVLPQCKDRTAAMHQRDETGKIAASEQHPYYHMTSDKVFHAAGHGLIGTVDDYLKVLTVLINEGKGGNGARILSPESTKEFLRNQVPQFADELDKEISAVIPSLTNPVKMQPGQAKGWSYAGLTHAGDLPTGRKSGSAEWAGLANLFWSADPHTGVATFIASQVLPFADPAVGGAWVACEKAVYDSLKA